MRKLSKREKLLLVTSITGLGVAGYFGVKMIDYNKLKNRVRILEEIVSEDVLDEAIATTTRKLNYRAGKIELFKTRTDDASIAKLEEHIRFKNIFDKRLKDFNELKRLRYIEE